MIIGLTGAAGSGKDSVADILVAERGFHRIAFADALYDEVSTAFNVSVEFLKNRETKEKRSPRLSLGHCMDGDFARVVRETRHGGNRPIGHSSIPYSPRQILQWWGTDYRRAQRESYWIDKVRDRMLSTGVSIHASCEANSEGATPLPNALYPPERGGFNHENFGEQVDWVLTDVRFQNEADLVQELGGQLGLVLRPGVKPVANHVSEEFWQTCSPDMVIENDRTLDELMADVCAMAGNLQRHNTSPQARQGAAG